MSTADPLSELLVDAAAVDRARIANALKGRLAVDSSSGHIVPQAGFDRLNARQKVLAFLLARKVALLLDVADKEAATPAEITDQTGLPPGTVRPTLSALFDEHLVAKRSSAYSLSSPQIPSAIDQISPDPDDGATARPGKRRRRPRATRPSKVTTKSGGRVAPDERAESKAASKSTAKGSVSPRALVMDLVNAGFLNEPKTLNDVQKQLKDKRGHQIPVTTLSPVFVRLLRAGEVEREKTADGVYAYQRSGAK